MLLDYVVYVVVKIAPRLIASRRFASLLHLVIHHIKHIPIQGQEALGRCNLLGGTGDIALPLAGVDLGEYWVTQHGPCSVKG